MYTLRMLNVKFLNVAWNMREPSLSIVSPLGLKIALALMILNLIIGAFSHPKSTSLRVCFYCHYDSFYRMIHSFKPYQ